MSRTFDLQYQAQLRLCHKTDGTCAQSNAGELILRNLQSDDPSFLNNLIISFSIIDLIIFLPTSI